jgi:hypothetical protein
MRQHDAGEGDAPPLSRRERGRRSVQRMGDAEIRKRRLDLATAHDAAKPGLECEIFPCRQFRLQAVAVGEIREAAAPGIPIAARVLAIALDAAGLRRQQAGDDAQKRRLARTVGSEDVNALAGRGLDRDAREHPPVTTPDFDALGRNA